MTSSRYTRALELPGLETRAEGFLRIARDSDAGFLLLWWGMPEGYQLDLDNDQAVLRALRLANPSSFVDVRELLRSLRRPTTDLNEWLRLHLNSWTASRDVWIDPARWAALGIDGLEPPEGQEVFAFVDAALYHDTTACVWAWLTEDGRIGLKAKVWSAREETPAHVFVPGGKIRMELVESFIRDELGCRYKVREAGGDARYFDRSMEILETAGLTTVEFVQASSPMADAWQNFYVGVAEGTLAHDRDPVLTAHVTAAAADKTEHGWRVRKLKSSGRIDALVAAAMAAARCEVIGTYPKEHGPTSAGWT